jgi:hypothetical protein
MIIENIQYWLWTGVGLQQSMIISSHYSCTHYTPFQKAKEMIIENIQYWLWIISLRLYLPCCVAE